MNCFNNLILNCSLLDFNMLAFWIVMHDQFNFFVPLKIMDCIEFGKGCEDVGSSNFIFKVMIGGITEVVYNFDEFLLIGDFCSILTKNPSYDLHHGIWNILVLFENFQVYFNSGFTEFFSIYFSFVFTYALNEFIW